MSVYIPLHPPVASQSAFCSTLPLLARLYACVLSFSVQGKYTDVYHLPARIKSDRRINIGHSTTILIVLFDTLFIYVCSMKK